LVTVSAVVYYVNVTSDGPVFPYATWHTAAATIQDAIAAGTLPGRLVLVTNGFYHGGFGLVDGTNRVALTNPVVVRSVNGPQVTTIFGGYGSIPQTRCAWVGDGAILSGFTLTHGQEPTSAGGGALCHGSGILTNCVLIGNFGFSRRWRVRWNALQLHPD
jgi:hypothetical protein